MQNANAKPQDSIQPQDSVPGFLPSPPSKPSLSMAERRREPDWGNHFWATLAAGLPELHLINNPYFPQPEYPIGGWRGVIEKAFKPPTDRLAGVAGPGGRWILTPEEATNQHAIDTAKRLLSEPPKHFAGPVEQTYFCFLEMGYSQFPDWAVVHREAGEITIHEDLLLLRPKGETTMEATVVGPLFQLHPKEVRLWEAVGMKKNRAFLVVETAPGDA